MKAKLHNIKGGDRVSKIFKTIVLSVLMMVWMVGGVYGETTYEFIAFPEGYTTAAKDGSGYFHDGLLGVKKEVEGDIIFDYVDTNGVLQNMPYATGMEFSDGLAPAIKDDKVGYIDTKGEVVIPFEYDYMRLGYWDGNPEDHPKLTLGKFFNGAVMVTINHAIELDEGMVYGSNDHEIYKNGDRTKTYQGSKLYSRDVGTSGGHIEKATVSYDGEEYQVSFVNDIGLIYTEFIRTEQDGMWAVVVERRTIPVIVKRNHKVYEISPTLNVVGSTFDYSSYDIAGRRYIEMYDFLYILNQSGYTLGVKIAEEYKGVPYKYVQFIKTEKYSGKKIARSVTSDLVSVPQITDYDIYIGYDLPGITTYEVNNSKYLDFELMLRGLNLLPIRDEVNNITGIDLTQGYQAPVDLRYVNFKNGYIKDEFARPYIEEAFKTVKCYRKDDKYYISLVLPVLPDEDIMRWSLMFDADNANGNVASSSRRKHENLEGGSYEFEVEGLTPAHMRSGVDFDLSLNLVSKNNRNASLFWYAQSYNQGKILEYDPRTEGQKTFDYDTTSIFENWK